MVLASGCEKCAFRIKIHTVDVVVRVFDF
jgi:hypothetical protein